jgi:hypothetical protein
MKLTEKPFEQLSTDELINLCYQQLNLKKEDADAVRFANAFIQFAEENLTRQLIELFSVRSTAPSAMTQKIDIVHAIGGKRFKPMISFLRQMNAIRNKVFHAKFSELKYKKENISNVKTQRAMFFDYFRAREDSVKD